MLLLLVVLTNSLAYSYAELERFEEFPPYVNANSFRPLGDKSERELRQKISMVIYTSLLSNLNGNPGLTPELGTQQEPYSGQRVDCTDSNRQPFNYRVLRKINGELLTRNITFSCQLMNRDEIIPFADLDPYGTMPYNILIKRV